MILPQHLSLQEPRVEGDRKKPETRGAVLEAEKLPPGCAANHGFPQSSNPFVQLKLPMGMTFENKKSRSVSYVSPDGPSFKGTLRSKESAVACMTSWAWQWWESLSDSQKNSVRSAAEKRRDRSTSASRKRLKTEV